MPKATKSVKSDSKVGYVILLLILIAFGAVFFFYFTQSKIPTKAEKFQIDKYPLVPKDKLVVYQGSTLPDTKPPNIIYDDHESLPTVDGKPDGDKSMFMMAFNKCDPSCCPSTYSCSGGCVCMTKDQVNFVGNRGNNSTSCQVI